MKPATMRVLLAGATGGIGQALAEALVQAGASVLLTGRSPARLAALARRLDPGAGEAVAWREADLLDAASVQRLADHAVQWQCNAVVHGAGAPSFVPAAALPPAELHRVVATNLTAPIALTTALLPHLARQPQARILFIGSALGAIGLPGHAAYCASKFGLRGYAQALRRELGPGALRVQYLGPRSTRTAFNDAAVQAYQRATSAAVDEPGPVAQAALAMLEDGRAERFLGFPECLAVRLNGAAPVLLDAAFGKHRAAVAATGTTQPT